MNNDDSAFELYGKYKNLYIFNTGKGSVLFKSLSYSKCLAAKRICNNYPTLAPIVEDDIWKECVIEHTLPGTVDTLNAGIVSTIVRLILGFSNPTSVPEIQDDLERVREESVNIRDDIIIKICQAFPSYTPEQVEDMEWRTQLRRLIQAEKILGIKFDLDMTEKRRDSRSSPAKTIGQNGKEYIDFEKENQALL